MPTYDYKCEKCGYEFERFQNIKDKALTSCPECGGSIKRLISTGAGIIFKGSGFYQTDYKNTCPKSDNKCTEDKKSSVCEDSKSCSCCGE